MVQIPLVLLVITAFILRDFLAPVIFASLFVLAFSPVYRKLLRIIKKPWILSSLLVMALMAVVVIPLTALTLSGIEEAQKFMGSTDLKQMEMVLNEKSTTLREAIQEKVESHGISLDLSTYEGVLSQAMTTVKNKGLNVAEGIIKTTPGILLDLTIFLMSVFFLSQGSGNMNFWFLKFWQDREEGIRFLKILKTVAQSVVTASLITGVLQTLVVFLFASVCGSSYGLLFALLTFVLSFVPVVGTLPVSGFMFLSAYFQGDIKVMVVYGIMMIILSTIDNFLKPLIIGNKTRLHPVLAFLAALGGLSTFGVIGLFLGPIIIATTIEFLE